MNLGEMDENGQLKIVENVKQLYDIWEDIKEDDKRENSQPDKDITVKYVQIVNILLYAIYISNSQNNYLSENYDYWQKTGHTARHSHKFHIKCHAMLNLMQILFIDLYHIFSF